MTDNETDSVLIEVNASGVVQVRGSVADAPFLTRIEPVISRLDEAIKYACMEENNLENRSAVLGIPRPTLVGVAGVTDSELADYLQGCPMPEETCSKIEKAAQEMSDTTTAMRNRFGLKLDLTDIDFVRALLQAFRESRAKAEMQAQLAQVEAEVASALKELAQL